jgi:hypothetical protein
MKGKFVSVCACAILFGVTSCDKNKADQDGNVQGEESVVKLTIYDQNLRATRGTGDEEAATTEESKVVDGANAVKVYVFTAGGAWEATELLTLNSPSSGVYTTGQFKISAGSKYVYVFANDAISSKIVDPVATTTRTQFEQQVINVTFDVSDRPDIAVDDRFLLGTLFGGTVAVPGGGTSTSPKSVALSIGRVAAKVKLATVETQGTGSVTGTFSNPSYRTGSIAKKVYTVGQFTSTDASVPPSAGGGWTVFSAVHDEAPETGPGMYNSAAFVQYSGTWKTPATDVFYLTENTTAEDAQGYLYYGNTSYIQLKTTYTPAASEVLDPTNLNNKVALGASGTFWTVQLLDGTRVIVGTDPTTVTLDINIDAAAPFHKYETGLNYHKFAIHDDDPNLGTVQKYSVLRNHYYEYDITAITTLGSYTESVDPTEPVPTDTEVQLSVSVKPWFKIASDVIL